MNRTYCLKRLLEHGPMTPKEITACTRWTSKQVHQAIDGLLAADLIRSVGDAYEAVTHGTNLPDLHPLAPKGQPSHGGAPAGALRPGADLEVSDAAALMHEAQAGDCGCRCGSGGVGG